MLTPPLYALKAKYFDNSTWKFVTDTFIMSPKEENFDINFKYFLSKDLNQVQKLMFEMITQQRSEIEALKVVELSHYPPYREYQVLKYYEMKNK